MTVKFLALERPEDVQRVLREALRHVRDGHLIQINIVGPATLFQRMDSALELAVARGELPEGRRQAVLVTGGGQTAPVSVGSIATPPSAVFTAPKPLASAPGADNVETPETEIPGSEPREEGPALAITYEPLAPSEPAVTAEAPAVEPVDDDGADVPPVPTAETETPAEEPANRRPGRRFGRGAGKTN